MTKVELIKQLKNETNVGISLCKTALENSDWDIVKAKFYLRQANTQYNLKPTDAGAIFSYVHHNKKIGVLLELRCGTDFVVKNEEFQALGNHLALHVAGLEPMNVKELLQQPSLILDGNTVEDYIKTYSSKFGEPIKVIRFTRFCL
jgi:elongation factor Ts